MEVDASLPKPVSPGAKVLASIITAQSEMTAAMPDSAAIMRLVTHHAMALSGATGASIGVRDGDEMYMPVNEGFTASWEGPWEPPLEIKSWRDHDKVWIAVVDKGPGIAPEEMGLIFSRFGRERNQTDHRIPGLGLGLYLSERIVEAHGGELTVKSTLGEGATFAFSVRVAP